MKIKNLILLCAFTSTGQAAYLSKTIDSSKNESIANAIEINRFDLFSHFFKENIIPDVNARLDSFRSKSTLLMVAASNKNKQFIELLIINGANVNFQNDAGISALMLAVLHDNDDVVKLLLEHEANPDLQSYLGMTSLMLAADSYQNTRAQNNIIRMLVASGADLKMQNKKDGYKIARHYLSVSAQRRHVFKQMEQLQGAYLRAVAAGEAERDNYPRLKRGAQHIIEEYIPIRDVANIVAGFAFGQSPEDLPEHEQKQQEDNNSSSWCTIS